jgi:hypothetical protein
MSQHSLVGEIVEIWHGTNYAFPYQPMKVLAIEDPLIQLGCIHGGECVHRDERREPKSFWVPLVHCQRFQIIKETSDRPEDE